MFLFFQTQNQTHSNYVNVLDDVTVSRKHAEVIRSGNSYSFKDSGSLNGTYLDGKISEQGQLQDGSELHIGKYRLHFFIGGRVRG